jgi:hypothetical protein
LIRAEHGESLQERNDTRLVAVGAAERRGKRYRRRSLDQGGSMFVAYPSMMGKALISKIK